jgi:hypothetical protein
MFPSFLIVFFQHNRHVQKQKCEKMIHAKCFAKHGKEMAGNNVSATIFPRVWFAQELTLYTVQPLTKHKP